MLQPLMPRAMALAICKLLEPSVNLLAGQLTKPKRRELVSSLKHLTIHIKHPRPIAEATITRGGIPTGEIDSKTMESKKLPGLFIAGEVLDVTGELGGYNLQWAWSSGWAAGQFA